MFSYVPFVEQIQNETRKDIKQEEIQPGSKSLVYNSVLFHLKKYGKDVKL